MADMIRRNIVICVSFQPGTAGGVDVATPARRVRDDMSPTIEQSEFQEITLSLPRAGEFFAQLIREASDMGASDLYLNRNHASVAISFRHLGLVKQRSAVSLYQGQRLVNYVKALAGMDVARKNRPQDGRWSVETGPGNKVDLRISTIPTFHGEDMSIRLMQADRQLLRLENLGFHQKHFHELIGLIKRPSGLILVTGPAGTGKTTTLYACLERLNNGRRRINTIEDPVEFLLPGVRQSQVNLRMDLDFPDLMRSVLRQTPDVIMVGEVRDTVTARTAVRAANAGQLVFATLHAPLASSAIDSLLTLGVNSHALGSSLLAIVAQRLMRTLCPHCKLPLDISATPKIFDSVRAWLEPHQGKIIYGAPGCSQCDQEGYTARTVVAEVLRVTKEIRRLILDGRDSREIRQLAIQQGMLDLRRSALLRVAQGVTSTEEMLRVIPDEQLAGNL